MTYSRTAFDQDLLTLSYNHYELNELRQNPWDANRTQFESPGDANSKISLSHISRHTAWAVYDKVARSGGEMYVGRLAQTQQLYRRFNLEDPTHFNLTPGLPINVQKLARWSVCINDCWILGAIHTHKKFCLVTKIRNPGEIYDYGRGFFIVTGRELYGLSKFGCEPEREWGSVMTFVCTNKQKADRATLRNYASLMGQAANSVVAKAKISLYAQGIY